MYVPLEHGPTPHGNIRTGEQRLGSAVEVEMPGAIQAQGQYFLEHPAREVSPGQSAATGLGVAAVTYGFAYGESALTDALARAATVVVGSSPTRPTWPGRSSASGQ
jgi:hypothetical protein